MPFLKKAPVTEGRSPERIALAAAVERHAAAVHRRAAVVTAQGAAEEAWQKARSAADASEPAVERAKEAAAQHLIAVAMGDAGPPPLSMKDARAALRDAEDALEAALAAVAALEAQRTAAERDIGFARQFLTECVADVVKASPGIVKLFAEHAAMQREVADRRAVLDWLFGKKCLAARVPDVVLRDAIDMTGIAPWQAALAALETDPDAPLPE